MKEFSGSGYASIDSIRHQGTVIVMASKQEGTTNSFCYKALNISEYDETAPLDEDHWTAMKELSFPDDFRTLGFNLTNVYVNEPITPFSTNFTLFSDQSYVYLFWRNSQGSLSFNRYIFSTANQLLQPAWETRYRRSKKTDFSDYKNDNFGSKNMDDQPFLEPIYNCPMIRPADGTTVGVVVTENQQAGDQYLNIFSLNSTNNNVEFFSLLRGDDGIPILTDKTIDSSGMILPDQTINLNNTFPNSSPSAVLYTQQEKIPFENPENNRKLKRSLRLMLAVPVGVQDGKGNVATFDIAVAKDGTLGTLPTDPIDLQFIDYTSMPLLNSDERGLTSYGAIFNPAISNGPVSLNNSGDGDLFLYCNFQGSGAASAINEGSFDYAVYSSEVARAIYKMTTSSANTNIYAFAIQTGTIMNDATVAVTAATTSTLCSLNLQTNSQQGENITETWYGLPIHAESFQAVLNGDATDNPLSTLLQTGNAIFYDYYQKWRVLTSQLVDSHNDKTGTSCLIQSVPTASAPATPLNWVLADGSDATHCDVTLSMTLGSLALQETWTDIPRDGNDFVKCLNGQLNSYDYSRKSVAEYPVCKVRCGSGEIWFVSRAKNIEMGSVTVEIDTSTTCQITLVTIDSTGNKVTNVLNLPRTAAGIIGDINGTGSTTASTQFWCFAAAPTELIEAQRISCSANLPNGSAVAVATKFGAGNHEAANIQVQKQGVEPALSRGNASHLFNFSIETTDFNLSQVLVASTVTNEQLGSNCNWASPKTRYSLALDESAVEISAEQNLDIEDNLAIEAWVYPVKFGESYVRIFHHSSTTTTSRYALGLKKAMGTNQIGVYGAIRETAVSTVETPLTEEMWSHLAFSYQTGYSLEFDGSEYVDCGNGDALSMNLNMSIEIWIKPIAQIADQRILISKYGGTANDQSYRIYLENNEIIFNFRTSALRDPGTGEQHREFECRATISNFAQWNYVAAVVSFKMENEGADVNTIIDARVQINDTSTIMPTETIDNETLQINISTADFSIGGVETNNPTPVSQSFKISDVRLWNKSLNENVLNENYSERMIASSQEGLVSYWTLNEGRGRETADRQKLNNALITSDTLWRFSRQGAEWKIYVNGEPQVITLGDANEFGNYTEQTTYIGTMTYANNIQQCYAGNLDEVRVWNRFLSQENVVDSMHSALSGKEKKLEGYWPLDKGSGVDVPDLSGHGNNGTFVTSLPPATIASTFTFTDKSQLAVSFDIAESSISQVNSSPVNGKFSFVLITNSAPTMTVTWTGNATLIYQVDSNPPQALVKDTQLILPTIASVHLLIGVNDRTIETLTYKNTSPEIPKWDQNSIAPVGLDAPICHEIGGKVFPENVKITGVPFVTEYGDLQKDSTGAVGGVLKRCHAFMQTGGKVCLLTSYKVGELEMSYIGQVQTRPTLIGYIEGAPPVPSENLTINDPVTDDYVGTSSVELVEQQSESYKYSTTSNYYLDASLDAKFGLFFGTETSAGVGVEQEVQKLEGKVGLHLKGESSTGRLDGVENASATDATYNNHVDLCGFWETKKDYDKNGTPRYWNELVGQRYLPNNMGYALVKSGTADLYALKLQKTGATFSYITQPNIDIPKDWNIIMFPLNPSYVKNGTLDGMVGLTPDPDYPSAISGARGSYFKPVEAYALKSQIDQEKEMIKTYYTQLSTTPSGISGDGNGNGLNGDLIRDWENKRSKRNLANTYVWTAQGGMYKEEEQFQDMKAISHGGSFKLSIQGGIYFELSYRAAGFGVDAQADVMIGPRWESEVVTTQEYQDSFGLNVDVTAEGWLNQYNPDTKSYEEFDCPGKVDAYRFFSFYLAPSNDNFSQFFDKVVDPNWLNNSNNPNALALMQAAGEENHVWRVLHRVTYVSRVPPAFKATSDESIPTTVIKPVNIDFNAWYIDLIKKRVGMVTTDSNIENAVDDVLDTDLKNLDPYWADFLVQVAADPGGFAAQQFYDIRNTSKAYMLDYFATI